MNAPISIRSFRTRSWYRRIATVAFSCASVGRLFSNPQGMTVVSGSASTQQNGPQLDVTVGQSTFLNWSSFNIKEGETTTFLQPSANSIVFNVIGDKQPSQIFGNLNANGSVILANGSGFYFGPHSMIKVGGSFVATTAPLPPDSAGTGSWQFNGLPPLASIVNYGQVQVGVGRSLFLIAENIENHGTLSAPAGNIGLYSAKDVLISERADGRGLSASVQLPSGAIDNCGEIVADAGAIALWAKVVNQNGIIQADSVRNQNGAVELVASDQLNLGAGSAILARGDDGERPSAGGNVTLKSENVFSDTKGGEIVTTGGAHGGNGGNVEISAPNILSLDSAMDARAQAGWTGGRFFLDPVNITLGTSGNDGAGDGTVAWNSGSGNLSINVNSAFMNKNFSQIDLQASGNITLAQNTVWNLSTSTGVETGNLTLQAGGNIVFGNNSQIIDPNHWSVTLQAGVSFPGGPVTPSGSIYLNGGAGRTQGGAIQTADGNITLLAQNDILVGTGYVRTTAGGGITADASNGDINAGTANGNYQFSIFDYSVSPNLGGISTAAGGNVSLTAGHDIVSQPTVPVGQPVGGSGAFGPEAGNVTLTAGHQIMGNYFLANGVGTILAGVNVNGATPQVLNSDASVGTSVRPVSLSLVNGSWNVFSGGNVYISEVRNPNGTFNGNQWAVDPNQFPGNVDAPSVPPRSAFLFDYAADAAVNIWAGNAIDLAGNNLPRLSGQNRSMPPIYAPRLTLNAGRGGILIENSIVLFPSSKGSLSITTRDGGNLVGESQQTTLTGITMSDSGLPGWITFAQGHALTPLHLNDANSVTLDISGNIETFGLTVPTFAHINVAGSTYNFGFSGRNLSPSQTTFINVAGDIAYRGDLSTVPLSDPLPAFLFNGGLSGLPEVAAKLRYNAANKTLTFIGQMTASELAFLLNPSEVVFDIYGQPILDAHGNPVTQTVTLTSAQQKAINDLFAASSDATLGDQGLALAGPGRFSISARKVDLGISGGITVGAPDSALVAISPFGANLEIHTTGDFEMTSSKIANESLLGGIQLQVGGALNVGSELTTFGDPNAPKGVFTTSGGDVSVTANEDVNVNGSRIAVYNGGSVLVESAHGSVNAGVGGSGFVSMNSLQLDPVTGQLISIPASIPGSGILATTLRGSHATLGNITVNAPEGDINASLGGIIQIAFNGSSSGNNFINLSAGRDINAQGSGIIGTNIKLKAGRDITGVIVGSQSVDLNSRNVDVTAFSSGNVNISASGEVSGVVVGGGSLNVSGDSISAALIGSSVSASGNTSSAAMGVPQSDVSKSDARVVEDTAATADQKKPDEDDLNSKKKGKVISLARRAGRVTVILPGKTK